MESPERPEQCPGTTGEKVRNENVSGTSGPSGTSGTCPERPEQRPGTTQVNLSIAYTLRRIHTLFLAGLGLPPAKLV